MRTIGAAQIVEVVGPFCNDAVSMIEFLSLTLTNDSFGAGSGLAALRERGRENRHVLAFAIDFRFGSRPSKLSSCAHYCSPASYSLYF